MRKKRLKSGIKPSQAVPKPAAGNNQQQSAKAPLKTRAAGKVARKFPIVGVCASAGGFEAFSQLLKALPANLEMAFVYVQHLSAKHASMLSELLARETPMPVKEIQHGERVEPNHVYVIPPNCTLAISGSVLHLLPRVNTGGQPMPGDYFLRSLAAELGNRAIGVILSGTASDGSLGLKAIKAEGGITFSQDEKSAKYDGMPHNAIMSGCVDFVLPPDEIARELASIARHPYVARPKSSVVEELPDGPFKKILALIRSATGVDLADYKQTTIKRRVMRRMALHKVENLEAYVNYIGQHPNEIEALYNDLLISVTQFFRDAESFEVLEKTIFPKLIKGRSPDDPVRIWVPGCSTGEEVYSLAISLMEACREQDVEIPMQVYATDLSELAISRARTGRYSENIINDVPADRLRRYFLRVESGYQVSKRTREMCIFARHDLTRDPPFPRLDLISCRNVLIYFGTVLQRRIMPILHYALKPHGYLLLGSSETVESYTDLFSVLDKKNRIYAKRSDGRPAVELPPMAREPETHEPAEPGAQTVAPPAADVDLQREVDRLILNQYAPAGVVINERMHVLQFRGRTGGYLEPAPGSADFNLLSMARPGLMVPLRNAIQKVRAQHGSVVRQGIRVQTNGGFQTIAIEVTEVRTGKGGSRAYLILFHPGAKSIRQPVSAGSKRQTDEVHLLRQELSATKEHLQAIIEDKEAANEELRSANEEAQSTNEELKSTNEELETTKEELQSTNEELNTVNEELQHRNLELSKSNDDLENFLAAVNIAMVMVDNDLRVRRFTPQAQKLLNLIPSDVGRPITNLKPSLPIPEMENKLLEVIETLRPVEIDVRDSNGQRHIVRMRPYRTADNRIEGAVLLVDRLSPALEHLALASGPSAALIEALHEPVVALDREFRAILSNAAFCQCFRISAGEVTGKPFFSLAKGILDLPVIRKFVSDLHAGKAQASADVQIDIKSRRLGARTLLLKGSRIGPPDDPSQIVVLAIEDVTERRRADTVLRKGAASLPKELRKRMEEITAANESLRQETRELRQTVSALRQNEAHFVEGEQRYHVLASRLIRLQEDERRRIATDLHDTLNQELALLECKMTQVETQLPAKQSHLSEALHSVRDQVGRISDDVSKITRRLHPSTLEHLGLLPAIRSFIKEFSRIDGLDVHFDETNALDNPPGPVALCLYRVLQEALRNVAKHSQSAVANVSLAQENGILKLEVSDSGIGFDVASKRLSPGLGLLSMEERVRMLNGKFAITSEPGKGTRVEAQVPLKADEQ
jgi:two-component system CheB/CheR fusion protein